MASKIAGLLREGTVVETTVSSAAPAADQVLGGGLAATMYETKTSNERQFALKARIRGGETSGLVLMTVGTPANAGHPSDAANLLPAEENRVRAFRVP